MLKPTHLLLLAVATPAVAAPQTPPTWTIRNVPGPSARTEAAMAYDSLRARTMLFGGGAGPSVLADTWEWDGSQWTPLLFAAGPTGRRSHAMAFDSARGRSVLFGGWNSVQALGDTWEWDGVSWIQAASGPPARSGSAMVYAAPLGGVVLFGGMDSSGLPMGDMWVFDGSAWSQMQLSPAPLARRLHAMAFDSTRARLVIYGGYSPNGPLSQLEEFDGSGFVAPAGGGLPGTRYLHSMSFDSSHGRTVMFGGWNQSGNPASATWEWDGTQWSLVSTTGPSARTGAALAFDAQRQRTVLMGGEYSVVAFADTWTWNSGYVSTASTFGAGCGTPPMALSPVLAAPPRVGTTAQVSITNVPAGFSGVALGWSNTALGPFTLPLPLGGYGMPGCSLLQSADAMAQATMTGASTASYSLPLPNWTTLVGLRIYLQAWAPAPGANPGNVIVSNGLVWGIGNT